MKRRTIMAITSVCFSLAGMGGCHAEDIAEAMYHGEVPTEVAEKAQTIQQDFRDTGKDFVDSVVAGVSDPFGYTPSPTEEELIAEAQEALQPTEEQPTEETEEILPADVKGTLEVHYIDVGQGDSTLISFEGEDGNTEYAVIDCGDNDKGTAVQKYLMDEGVDRIKYLILTHPDADHIGGADVIITKFDVENILVSSVTKDTRTYEDVVNAISYRGYDNITRTPEVGESLWLGGAEFTVMASPTEDYGDVNNGSIVMRLQYGNVGYLFMGDAEYEEEMDLVELYKGTSSLDTDILKVGHHGSKTSSNEEILDMITPEYAVISCGEGNSYHHPHKTALTHLQEQGLTLFRTDEQGSIISTTDGYSVQWITEFELDATWDKGADAGDVIMEQEGLLIVEDEPEMC